MMESSDRITRKEEQWRPHPWFRHISVSNRGTVKWKVPVGDELKFRKMPIFIDEQTHEPYIKILRRTGKVLKKVEVRHLMALVWLDCPWVLRELGIDKYGEKRDPPRSYYVYIERLDCNPSNNAITNFIVKAMEFTA